MTRNLTTALKNELATYVLRPIHLVYFGFSTPVYLTDCSFELTSSISGTSQTYTPTEFIQNISEFTEETNITKSSLRIGLSNVNQTYLSITLNENVINDKVNIYRGFLDTDNTIIADPFLLYDGQIDKYQVTETDKESNIVYTIVSHWADFEKIAGRKTNPTSQQRFFSGDQGMEFSSQTVQDIKWGKE
jgi:hypothetical protein